MSIIIITTILNIDVYTERLEILEINTFWTIKNLSIVSWYSKNYIRMFDEDEFSIKIKKKVPWVGISMHDKLFMKSVVNIYYKF